ncbi:potassium-transporting ATPase subunit KdpC [Sandaracinobacteroides saxicola]|uniref:Potassium-transporting ATPase KdpC subunit n=1 Tax=Sandaracinobacteroides saxicola TaxID=2759707 RepID=A0A7G5ILG2_9SPHN|nr:potassium-transporting ATPase subunit KdpC [Sandaracinobacteroides saxicola]QMW24204.1 potassium-transporting ATPase subunit KdpC [Sandaracinobacteroides saxicola]
MFTEVTRALRPAIVLLLLLTLLTGLAYPALVTAIAQAAMPAAANGSLVRDGERIVGSALIGQNFARADYFHPRPSAAGKHGYDASASAATNLAPGSRDLRDAIAGRVADDAMAAAVPADLVTTSASGLDPDISPAAALVQVARVAGARGLPRESVEALVRRNVDQPLFGIIGEPRVNVLLLNRQLDALSANQGR